jgi:hypothetical protein
MISNGKVIVETSANAQKFGEMISALNLEPPILIKPNWGTVECYTEAEILDWALSVIQGETIVIESFGWARNEETLLGKNPAALRRENLRKGDRWFLEYSGIDKVLEKHHVEYLNFTEEIWAGRTADPNLIQQAVEEQYPPVHLVEMYGQVPARLYALRGGTLLSLAKYRLVFDPITVTFSIKNLFGLIPGPSRGKFHGKDHSYLDQSIVDINKIYRSLFSVKGVIEAVFTAGDIRDIAAGQKVAHDCGLALGCENTINLDAFTTAIGGRDPQSVGYLKLAAQHFGSWDPQVCAEAKQSGIQIF